MTGVQTLAARLLLGGVAGLATITLPSIRAIHRPSPWSFRRGLLGVFVASRLLIFAVIFLLLRLEPRGDIPAYYFPEGALVLGGALPYRDFHSSYAPLHSYLDGAVLLLWHSPLALILFAMAAEFLLLNVWLRLGPQLFSERVFRIAAVLYLCSAVSIQFVSIDGQDNVVVALLIAISVALALRSRWVLSGISVALAAVMVKLIPIFYAPVFAAGLRRRWGWVLGFVAVLGLGYGSFALHRLPILQPLTIEGSLRTAGTLSYVVSALSGKVLPIPFWEGVMLLVLALIYAAVWRVTSGLPVRSQVLAIVWGVAASTLALVTFSNKSWPPYLMLILFPLCALIAQSGVRSRVAFALFGAVALVEHSYWATLLRETSAIELRPCLLAGDPERLVFLLLEFLLLGGYLWLLLRCVSRLRRLPLEEAEDAGRDGRSGARDGESARLSS